MNVTIVGAGLMGAGIAQVFLVSGHDVVLHDISSRSLAKAQERIKEINALLQVEPDSSRLSLSSDLEQSVESANVVFETVVEDLDIKRDVFRRITESTDSDTILASNTSAIPIGTIAAGLDDPGRILGAHFWNPPWAVDLVEVIEAEDTRSDIVRSMMQLLSDACLQPVHVRRDIPGCIGNRLQHALKREAIALVESGVCDADTIDTVVKSGFGSRLGVLGPLEQSDLVGLDLTLSIHETLIADLDTSPGPADLLKQRVAEGRTGMAVGNGFREWTADSAAQVKQRLSESLAANGRARISRLRSRMNSGPTRTTQ